jgi:hypothetical protein
MGRAPSLAPCCSTPHARAQAPTHPWRLRETVRVPDDPSDDALLGPADVAAWLDVDEGWLARAVRSEALPVMGFTSAGEPVVAAAEVRAWLRRPDPSGDQT